MPGTTVFGIPNCDRVRKARAWLVANGVAHTFHDIRKQGLTPDRLAKWIATSGWPALLNRKGTTWRGLDDARKAKVTDADAAAALMLEFPTTIQRPIVETDGRILVGFDEAAFERQFTTPP